MLTLPPHLKVAHLAPKKLAPALSWVGGWFTLFGWVLTTTIMAYLTGGLMQGMIRANIPILAWDLHWSKNRELIPRKREHVAIESRAVR